MENTTMAALKKAGVDKENRYVHCHQANNP